MEAVGRTSASAGATLPAEGREAPGGAPGRDGTGKFMIPEVLSVSATAGHGKMRGKDTLRSFPDDLGGFRRQGFNAKAATNLRRIPMMAAVLTVVLHCWSRMAPVRPTAQITMRAVSSSVSSETWICTVCLLAKISFTNLVLQV